MELDDGNDSAPSAAAQWSRPSNKASPAHAGEQHASRVPSLSTDRTIQQVPIQQELFPLVDNANSAARTTAIPHAASSKLEVSSTNPATDPVRSGPIDSTYGVRTLREEEMRYRLPQHIFCDPRDASYPFDDLVASYFRWLETRERPASPATIETARDVLKSFRKSLVLHDRPLAASSINPGTYDDWRADLRQARLPWDPHPRSKKPRTPPSLSAPRKSRR